MKKIFVVIGTNNILNVVGPVGGAVTQELADSLAARQAWKLDTSKVFAIDVAESEEELRAWQA